MEITIEIKSIYGNETIYPACEKSQIFADMLHQKTLTRKDISSIVKLGYEIMVKQKEFNFK